MVVNATTLAKVKELLGDAGTANDALLLSIIDSVSREFEGYVGYELEQKQRTEDYDLGLNDEIIFLRNVPVVSVAEVKVWPSNWDFASATALTADRDYRLGPDGQLFLNIRVRAGFQKARVTYTAGLGATDAAVIAAAPDLALAATIQVAEEWRRRRDPSTISVPTPKGAKQLASPHRLLERARELLSWRRRIVLV